MNHDLREREIDRRRRANADPYAEFAADDDPLADLAVGDPLEDLSVPDPARVYDQASGGMVGTGMPAVPTGFRETRNRVLELPEVDISVDPRGERPDVVRTRGEATEYREVAPHERSTGRSTTADAGALQRLYAWASGADPRALGPQAETLARSALGVGAIGAVGPVGLIGLATGMDRSGERPSIGGRELPSLESASRTMRALQRPPSESGIVDSGARLSSALSRISQRLGPASIPIGAAAALGESLMPVAERPAHMRASEPDHRDRAGMYGLQQNNLFAPEIVDEASGVTNYIRTGGAEGSYESGRDAARSEIERSHRQAPEMYMAGMVGASLPALMGGGRPNPAGAGPTRMQRILTAGGLGLGQGTLRGAGASEAEDVGGVAQDAVRGGVIEGALSAGLAGGGELAAPLLARLAPLLQRGGQWLRDPANRARISASGVRASQDVRQVGDTPQARERFAETLRETGISRGVRSVRGASNRAGRVRDQSNETITRVFDEADEAAQRASASYRGGGPAPGEVDGNALIAELQTAAQRYDRPSPEHARARAIILDFAERLRPHMNERGGVALRSVNDVRDALAPSLSPPGSGRPSQIAQRAEQELYGIYRGAMSDAIERVNPELRVSFDRAMQQHRVASVTRTGADRTIQRHYSNAPLSASDLFMGGTGASGTFAYSGDPLTAAGVGLGLTAANRLVRGRGHAAGAFTLERLSGSLRALGSPQAQRWANILAGAEQRGAQSLAAANFMLTRTDPEYRATLERLQEERERIEREGGAMADPLADYSDGLVDDPLEGGSVADIFAGSEVDPLEDLAVPDPLEDLAVR